MDLQIILPAVSQDPLSDMLVEITKAIDERKPESVAHGLLGGEHGYGGDWDSDVFMMHPFCWCDKDDCQWCDETMPNFWHKLSGLKVWWYKYIGRGMVAKDGPGDLSPVLAGCLADIRSATKQP